MLVRLRPPAGSLDRPARIPTRHAHHRQQQRNPRTDRRTLPTRARDSRRWEDADCASQDAVGRISTPAPCPTYCLTPLTRSRGLLVWIACGVRCISARGQPWKRIINYIHTIILNDVCRACCVYNYPSGARPVLFAFPLGEIHTSTANHELPTTHHNFATISHWVLTWWGMSGRV